MPMEPRSRTRQSACATWWSASAIVSCWTICRSRCAAARFSGFVGGSGSGKSVLLRTIIGLLPKRQGSIEVFGVDLDRASRCGTPRDRAALGHSVPAGRAVLVADGAAERAVSDARVPGAFRQTAAGGGAGQARDGRPRCRRRRQASLRALGRHDQAGGACARARPRSRDRLSGRADVGPRPDRGRRFRRADQDAAADARAHGVHGHARPGEPQCRLRSHRRPGRRPGGRRRGRWRRCSVRRIRG